jgi:hypothetical protein
MEIYQMSKHKLFLTVGLCVLLCSLLAWTVQAQIQTPLARTETLIIEDKTSSAAADWLEPRGLNIVDMVGFVPEEYLEGVIISYTPGYGILTYESGERVGNTVTVTATVSTRYIVDQWGWKATMFGCLGQPARIDQWGSTTPPTTMRIYHDEQDVTDQIDYLAYVPDGKRKPIRDPKSSELMNQYRYWESAPLKTDDRFTPDGALNVPANMGCEFIIEYQNYKQLTAVFVAQVESRVSMDVVGTEEFTFRSYLGAGTFGLLDHLAEQLSEHHGGRHDKFSLNVPTEADYFFLRFPPLPVDVYTAFPGNPYDNVDRPSSGTYRIWGPSTDHVNTMGMPLHGQWLDMDRAGDATYLPYFDDPDRLSCPEYLVPAGVDYDPCMISGECSSEILDAIWNTPMTMTMVYLHVTRTSIGVDRIPLKMVGPNWQPGDAAADIDSEQASASTIEPLEGKEASGIILDHTTVLTYQAYLPLVFKPALPPDDPTGCPCGWFTSDGRMVDFIPEP